MGQKGIGSRIRNTGKIGSGKQTLVRVDLRAFIPKMPIKQGRRFESVHANCKIPFSCVISLLLPMVEGPAVLEALAGVVIGVQQGQLLREVLVNHSWAEHADQLITCGVLFLDLLRRDHSLLRDLRRSLLHQYSEVQGVL
jgi:hypothetical protein